MRKLKATLKYSVEKKYRKIMSQHNNNTKQEQPKPTAPKVDKKELEQSIKSHEKAVKTNQIVKK